MGLADYWEGAMNEHKPCPNKGPMVDRGHKWGWAQCSVPYCGGKAGLAHGPVANEAGTHLSASYRCPNCGATFKVEVEIGPDRYKGLDREKE